MKSTIAAVAVLCSSLAFAGEEMKMPVDAVKADSKGAAMKADTAVKADANAAKTGETMKDAAANPMANWKAPKVTKEDKAGLNAFYKEMEGHMMKGDMAACGNMMAPTIMMVTDGSKGGSAETWTRDQWVKTMTQMSANMPKDIKWTAKHKYTFLSDNLAVAHNDVTQTMGKTKQSWKNADVLMKADGKWHVVSMIEGGWGDVMAAGTGGTGSMTK